MTMQLKALSIHRPERYDPDYKLGTIRGHIELEGMHSKVAVKLSDEQCRQILAIVGQAAKDTTEAAVRAMTAEMFNLPSPTLIEG
jgi:hypothetical protein